MAIQEIPILRNYMTCEDEAVRNKYFNLLDSFYHKSEGKILESISENATAITLQFTDGNPLSTNTSVVIPKLPESQEISFITGLKDALDGKVGKVPGKGLSDQNFSLAEKQKLGGLENYVKPNSEDISYIEGLQDALNDKVDKEAGMGLSANDFTDVLKQKLDALNVRAEQIINSGGNYNNFEPTGNVLIFNNTNAQAIITGFKPDKYKRLTLINNSTFELRLNAEDINSIASQQIKLPTGLASIGVQGTAELVYIDSIQKWQIVDSFASKYRPEHRGLTEARVEVVLPNAVSETREIIELIVFRDAQSTDMTQTELNTAYPNRNRGFQVVCKEIGKTYVKEDDNTNEWHYIIHNNVPV